MSALNTSVTSDGETDYAAWVNPFIGTASTGNTFPGATMPFGMVQLTPIMNVKDWNYNSGYHRDAGTTTSPLMGFALTAISGVGLNDGGDFVLLPAVTAPSTEDAAVESITNLVHDSEKAHPGYYRCVVAPNTTSFGVNREIEVELAAHKRSGMMRAQFQGNAAKEKRMLLLHLKTPLDMLERGKATLREKHLVLSRRSSFATHSCGTDHTTYAAIETNYPILEVRQIQNGLWCLEFDGTKQGQELLVRVGLSHVDEKGARDNLQAELGESWDFQALVQKARRSWNDAFRRAHVEGDKGVLVRFYSAFYHALLGPTLFSDADRRVRLTQSGGRKVQVNFDFYSTFSLWDTYRAQHPFLNLLFPELAPHFAKSLLAIKESLGRLPRWVLFGRETNCMLGYPAAIVLSEAALKGLLKEPGSAASPNRRNRSSAMNLEMRSLEAAVHSSWDAEGNDDLERSRPISLKIWESVSKLLEYAWADSCISKFSEKAGKHWWRNHYLKRSRVYRLNFNRGVFLPRKCVSSCSFDTEDDFIRLSPTQWTAETSKYFIEGTPLQYSFMVPHDIPGLLELLGGVFGLQHHLDRYFYQSVFEDKKGTRDLETGHLGSHVQGNEPGHHVPYMYNFAETPWKAQEVLDTLMAMYTVESAGLPGNDDVGQMSAWFIFSALGIYPVDPCDGNYSIGRPVIQRAKLHVQKGVLDIIVDNQSSVNKYVHSLSWNCKPLIAHSIRHNDIIKGGRLIFTMSNSPYDFRDNGTSNCGHPVRSNVAITWKALAKAAKHSFVFACTTSSLFICVSAALLKCKRRGNKSFYQR